MVVASSYFLTRSFKSNKKQLSHVYNEYQVMLPGGQHSTIGRREDGAGDRIVADVTQGVVHVNIPRSYSFRYATTCN